MPHTASETQLEIDAEQAYLDRVYKRLRVVAADAEALAREGYDRAQNAHYGGLVERDAFVHHAARRIRMLGREHEGLVFGRLDLDTGEIRYVGRLGILDESFEPLVIDWRAPAAAPFYGATAENRMGVVRRRVIRSSGERVLGVEDDLLDPDGAHDGLRVVGDGALMAALSRSRGGTMRDIVATIQQEQDQVIRAPANQALLLRGGPGTGKTVVALHRAAYILYRDRRRFESGGVLVVGPSSVFVRYIERVLPALGEDSATLRSIGDVVDDVTAVRHDPPDVAAVKGSQRMVRVLRKAVREAPPGAPTRFRLLHAGRLLELDARQLAAVRRTVISGNRKPNRSRPAAASALAAALWEQANADSPGPGGRSRAAFEAELTDRDDFGDFLREWWPYATARQVLDWLGERDRLAHYARGALPPADVDRLAASWSSPPNAAGVSIEDVALLDELRSLLGDPPPPPPEVDELEATEVPELSTVADRDYAVRARRPRPENYEEYAHIIVDEAQDLSPMQWRMLGRRGRHATWTIVGDTAQSAWPDPAESTEAMDRALGRQRRAEFRLSTNYRNSAEIFDLAAEVIRAAVPDADLPAAVRHTGHPPRHVAVDGPAELAEATRTAVSDLLSEMDGPVGVITAAGRRETVSGWLTGLAADSTDSADPADRADRVSVVDGLQAKGLEYDAVVAVEPADIVGESARGVRVLYVALTRATQRLVTVGTDRSWLPDPD